MEQLTVGAFRRWLVANNIDNDRAITVWVSLGGGGAYDAPAQDVRVNVVTGDIEISGEEK